MARDLRLFYLHGFASGPSSKKGCLVAEHFEAQGRYVERLDLRVPSFEHMRVSSMIETTREALGGAERAVLLGSSLGGLVAGRVAASEPRVVGLLLLAPAFGFAPLFRQALGPEGFAAYRASGWYTTNDAELERDGRVDFGFYEDLARADAPGEFPAITVPTTIVHGVGDTVIPIAGSRRFAATRPHVRLVEVDDGHELRASIATVLAEAERLVAALTRRASGPVGA
jgi:pimeloyl-ACP methyl ester carboxylesterase